MSLKKSFNPIHNLKTLNLTRDNFLFEINHKKFTQNH